MRTNRLEDALVVLVVDTVPKRDVNGVVLPLSNANILRVMSAMIARTKKQIRLPAVHLYQGRTRRICGN